MNDLKCIMNNRECVSRNESKPNGLLFVLSAKLTERCLTSFHTYDTIKISFGRKDKLLMKQIGKEVCFLRTGVKNPRNGECSFLRLHDGRIMCIYTKYYGDDWTDHAIARLEAIYSSDEGETWSESSILIEKDEEALNIMAASLIRLDNGNLGVLYLR